ncbi:WD repeat-containing protein 62-like isoform X2 [Mixophyes fleayi]|uniref:WD repeat-containing protein 62-like isoform X2 n=1 Tax=Mixophyes fleayi TaxID=3061075 RepID=UPI003F4DD8FA
MSEGITQDRAHPGVLPLPSHPSPSCRKSSRGNMGTASTGKSTRQVELEKILGITVSNNSSLTCDPNTGLIAYPAGCVIVLLCPRNNKQAHIFNTSCKQLSALSFSPDGKYIVAGESGHKPAVRIWDVAEKVQVMEMLGHKYGVSCVCFSPNMKYVVSVGYQHDMVVNVWDWKNNNIVATNKVSSKVSAVSFSEDSSYFVTTGQRHVKFWYLESSKKSQMNGTVPLVGRSGLLGDLQNNTFCGVACGKGRNAGSVFCVSYSGVLCKFNEKRFLEKWLKLKVSSSYGLCVTEDFVFCGCEDGVIRMFNAQNLQYVTDLPKPHHLGVDVALGLDPSSLFTKQSDSSYPDTCALVYDRCNQWLCCVYNDHSVYVWDVRNTRKVGKVYSALYHSSYVWNIEVPLEVEQKPCLTHGSFFTCSSDNTIRLWNLERSSNNGLKKNIYSNDLHKVIYVDDNMLHLKDTSGTVEKPESKDSKSGIRVVKIRHDGRQLASGDRTGNIRIYDLENFEELLTIEAHDGEVLCLEYSRPLTGVTLLASASRDRLIHILNVNRDYSLLQTLDDHSSSITAVKFAGDGHQMHMISCGADKSLYFRPAQLLPDGIHFVRLHHVVEKTTLYDLDVDVTQRTAAVACQDKTVRLYSVLSGKQEKALKSSPSGGALLKVQMDPSGRFLATSCSNKNISLFDLQTGDCVAVMYGHSDIVTDMKFTHDCKRLITVSGDSCIFIWQLNPLMTTYMKQHLDEMSLADKPNIIQDAKSPVTTRRETFIVDILDESSHDDLFFDKSSDVDEPSTNTPSKDCPEPEYPNLQTNGRMPLWVKKLDRDKNEPLVVLSQNHYRPQGRWAKPKSPFMIQNFLDGKDLSYCGTPNLDQVQGSFLDETTEIECIEPKNLQQLLELEQGNDDYLVNGTLITEMSTALEDTDMKSQSLESYGIFYPSSLQMSQQEESDFTIEERIFDKGHDPLANGLLSSCDPDEDSLTSDICSEADLDDDVEHNCRSETPEQEKFLRKHFDTLSDIFAEEKFDNSLKDLKPDEDDNDFILNQRLSFSSRFLCLSHRSNRLGIVLLPRDQQMVTATNTELKVESDRPKSSRRVSDKQAEKAADVQERRLSEKNADFSFPVPSLQKVEVNETAASRSSYPGYNPKKTKCNKGRSYMEATSSSKAKIFRSVSMGDGINVSQAEDQRRLSDTPRPLSSMELFSIEQNKCHLAEDKSCKPLSSSTSYEHMSSGQHERTKSVVNSSNNTLSDDMLMPPPATCGVIQRSRKKAKSVNNLSKLKPKEELNDTIVKPKDEGDALKNRVAIDTQNKRTSSSVKTKTQDVHDFFPRRASIAEIPTYTAPIIHPNNNPVEGSIVSRVTGISLSTSSSPFSSSFGEPNVKGLLHRCENVIEELHSTFQKTLETYKEIESCRGSHEEKTHLSALFLETFDHIQSEMELVGRRQKATAEEPSTSEGNTKSPTLNLLEHYSEMMLQIMREKIGIM